MRGIKITFQGGAYIAVGLHDQDAKALIDDWASGRWAIDKPVLKGTCLVMGEPFAFATEAVVMIHLFDSDDLYILKAQGIAQRKQARDQLGLNVGQQNWTTLPGSGFRLPN